MEIVTEVRGWFTLLVAGYAAFIARRAWKREGDRDAARVEREQREFEREEADQASRVSAWLSRRDRYAIRNDSGSAVRDLELEFWAPGTDSAARVDRLGQAPPGTTTELPMPDEAWQALWTPLLRLSPAPRELDIVVVLRFTDAVGQRWERGWDGKLRKV